MTHIIVSTLAASSIFFTSCGDKKESATGINKDNLNPAAAVENWKKDLTEGNVANLWDSLPESYQGDLNELASNLGENMDSEVYNEAMNSMQAITSLLTNKKEMILDILKETAPEDQADKLDQIENSYDSVVGLLSTIANSDAKDIDGMKKLDIGKLLGELQVHTKELSKLASLAGDQFEMVKAAKITLVSESDDSAELKISSDGSEEDVKIVKKDGRWLPAEMVEGWSEMLAEANVGINEMGEMSAQNKQQALMGLGMVKSSIKSLESTKTKEEMMAKVKGLMGMFGM